LGRRDFFYLVYIKKGGNMNKEKEIQKEEEIVKEPYPQYKDFEKRHPIVKLIIGALGLALLIMVWRLFSS
jgi:hypothetical protein